MNFQTISLAAFLSLAGPAYADDLSDIADSHIAWRGGAAFESLSSLTQRGKLEVSGLEGTTLQHQRADGHQILEYDLKVIKGVQGITPDDGWEMNPAGQLDDLGEAAERSTRQAIDVSFGLSLQGKGEGTLRFLGSEDHEDEAFEVVQVAFEDGNTFDYLLNPKDGSMTWMRSTSDKQTTWTKYSDWRIVDGVRIAFREDQIFEQEAQNQSLIWSEIEVNPKLDSSLFARPAKAADVVTFADGANSTGWIPFDFFRQQRVFLDGTLNGHTASFILDSGAELTAVDISYAERIGLKGQGEFAAQGTGGTTTVQIATAVTLTIANMTLSNLTVAIIDLGEISERMGRDLPIILGEEVFHETIVDIDYPRHRIAFHEVDGYQYDGMGTPVEIVALRGGQKDIPFSIEGLPTTYAGLDTGSGGTLAFFKAYTDSNNLLEGRMLSTSLSGGVGGSAETLTGTIKSLEFAGVTFNDVPVHFSRQEEGAFDTTLTSANLGVQILRRFRTTFDYSNSTLYFELAPEDLAIPFDKNRSGLQTIPRGDALEVFHVAKASPAQAQGWKTGDKITTIDGKPIGADYWDSQYGWQFQPAGTKVTLQLDDGKVRKLTLEDYF
jgi:membrane-associated protease RseP (regulator of RpoE activity)